jgi:hypothetical protein
MVGFLLLMLLRESMMGAPHAFAARAPSNPIKSSRGPTFSNHFQIIQQAVMNSTKRVSLGMRAAAARKDSLLHAAPSLRQAAVHSGLDGVMCEIVLGGIRVCLQTASSEYKV